MMRRAGIVLAALTAVLAWPQAAEKKIEGPKPIDALAWLVGGVWTADTSAMGNGMRRIETRYQWSDNNRFLRFTTHFVFDQRTLHTYDGNFFWDPQQKSLAMWYMNANSEIVAGTMVVEGDTWTMTFRGTDFEGKVSDLRTQVIRKTPDLYHWSVSEKQIDRWKELMSLDYRRLAGS